LKNISSNILTVIQARRSSSRLPDKIFLPLCGKPLLFRMYERVNSAKTPMKIVVATTTEKEDDKTEIFCKDHGIDCFRGDRQDLLDRHYMAALEFKADTVVKIPSDCPLICPDVIDRVLNYYAENSYRFDFVSNLHPPTYPDGHDVEVMNIETLKTAWQEADRNFEREHTTPFIWERPERFRIGNVEWETGLDFSMSHRMTIDYAEDYEFIKEVFENLFYENNYFKLCDIMLLLDQKPELKKINRKHVGVNWYRNHPDELKTVGKNQFKKSIKN